MTGTFMAAWEDEETNRSIQFAVNYTTANGNVEVCQVTPLKVSFICTDSNTCLRSVGVHTEAGRRMLTRQFEESGKLLELREEILARTGSCISA